jgi:hypothetical protein
MFLPNSRLNVALLCEGKSGDYPTWAMWGRVGWHSPLLGTLTWVAGCLASYTGKTCTANDV